MTLTIAQALREFPVLSKARVVAGASGLDRTIRWTHIIDHPDVVPWAKEGHLLLTTAFAIMLHPDKQVTLIKSLDEKKLAGMMVNIGQYMLEIPKDMIVAADLAGFPLIALPWEVDLSEVTHAIHESILQEQYALAEKADHIHQSLTRLVLHGGDLAELTSQMGDILQCSVTIEDESLRLLAHTTREPTDEVRRRSIQLGRTPEDVVEALREQGFFETLLKSQKPYHLVPNPAIGFMLDRIVSPIMVGSQLYGYIWIIASDRPLTSLDYLVIERGAVVAALIISRMETIYETEQRIKSRLFEGSINPDASLPLDDLPEGAWSSYLQKGYTLLVIESAKPDRQSLRQLAYRVEDKIKGEGFWATAIELGRRIAVIVGTQEAGLLRRIAEEFTMEVEEKGYLIKIGISAPAQQEASLRQSYQQALDALTAASALDEGTRKVWSYDELGFLGELISRPAGTRPVNRYSAMLQEIEKYDREKKTSYLITLETYLDHQARPNLASKLLFIHRNTLYQRLEKMRELWNIDFQDPLFVLNLNMAIKDWRLNQPQ